MSVVWGAEDSGADISAGTSSWAHSSRPANTQLKTAAAEAPFVFFSWCAVSIEGCEPLHSDHSSGFKVKKLSYHNVTEQRCSVTLWYRAEVLGWTCVFSEISHRQAFKCKAYLISWLKCCNPGVPSGSQCTTTHFSLKVQIWVMCTLQRHANQALILMNDICLREN